MTQATDISNIELEQEILGLLMTDNALYDLVAEHLSVEDFYLVNHAQVFAALAERCGRGEAANPWTLVTSIAADPDRVWKDLGDPLKYLVDLMLNSSGASAIVDYARNLRDLGTRRRIAREAQMLIVRLADVDTPLVQSVVELRATIDGQDGATRKPRSLGEVAVAATEMAAAAARGERTGVPTGLADLDRYFGGFDRASVTLIGGRPSMGKTALAQSIGIAAARDFGVPTAMFSMEMRGEMLGQRALAEVVNVPYSDMRMGRHIDPVLDRMGEAAVAMRDIPFYVDDRTGLNVQQIAAAARAMKRRWNIGLLIVDYLQLVQATNRYAGSRVNEVSEISAGLLRLAGELDVPVVALSQLSRELERREDKRPMLADLRDSGSLEQDASNVLFVYRHLYYLQQREPDISDSVAHTTWQSECAAHHNRMDIIVAKQRMGATATTQVFFDPATNRVRDLHHAPAMV